jgi:hypothetical protein
MQAREIFELIVKADERLKYSTSGKQDTRERQARELLERALAAATEIGDEGLVHQARQRLDDLGHPDG